jgi:hypothetical protein
MQCDTVKSGVECNFMSKNGCGFLGGACRPIDPKCEGCDRTLSIYETAEDAKARYEAELAAQAKPEAAAGTGDGAEAAPEAQPAAAPDPKPRAKAKYCAVFPDPTVKWRLGNCNMATHIKVETKGADSKVRVGQQKQKKK